MGELVIDAARRASLRRALTLVAALVACGPGGAGTALAASSLEAAVDPPTPGTAAAPAPVAISLRAAVTAPSGALPPALRVLQVALPDGFAAALDGVAACDAPRFDEAGSGGCPAASRLGSGRASFVYVVGALRLAATTQELVLFRGRRTSAPADPLAGDALFLYLRVTQPAPFDIALPGTLTERPAPAGPVLTLDLSQITRIEGGGSAVVTRAALDLTRGFTAGPCPARAWAFGARLEYVGGGVEEPVAQAPCNTTSDTTAPVLRASVRDGTRATGARFAIRLSEASTLRLTLERRTRGRWVTVRRAAFSLPGGSSVVRIRRAGGHVLASGRYRARLRAVDAAGLLSPKRTLAVDLR